MGRHNTEAKKAYRKRQKRKKTERKRDFLRGKNCFCNVLPSETSTESESSPSTASTCNLLHAPAKHAEAKDITSTSDTLAESKTGSKDPDTETRSSVTNPFASEQHSTISEGKEENLPAGNKKKIDPLYTDSIGTTVCILSLA